MRRVRCLRPFPPDDPGALQRSLQAIGAPAYLYEHMFPPLLHLLRNAAIRYADLALALLTLDAVRLPDRLFAPAAEPEAYSAEARTRRAHPAGGGSDAPVRADRPYAGAPGAGVLRPVSAAACLHSAPATARPQNFTTAARRGAAATESRASGTFPVSTRRR